MRDNLAIIRDQLVPRILGREAISFERRAGDGTQILIVATLGARRRALFLVQRHALSCSLDGEARALSAASIFD